MSAYTEKINNHKVHGNLIAVQELLHEIESMSDKPPADIESLARIAQVVKNFATALETCDSNLIAVSWLEDASNALANAKSYLSNYKSNRDPNQLVTHTFNQLETVLHCSVKLNCVKSKQALRGLTETISEYTRVMDAHIEQVCDKATSLADDVSTLKAQINTHEESSRKNLETLQQAINSEKQRLDGFATSYQNQMATDRTTFSDMTNSLKATFSDAQDERKRKFEIEIEEMKSQEKEQREKFAVQTAEFAKEKEQFIEVYQKKFDDYVKQAENIVGIVNTNMFSYKYKEVADDAHKRARLWHVLAVVLMLLVSIFAGYYFVITVNETMSWVTLVAKIFATTTLVAGAAYSARQASKQEKVERYARKIEMELVAIDPFIASIEEERRSLIKEEIAKKIFGNADAMEISASDEAYPAIERLASIEDITKSILSFVSKG